MGFYLKLAITFFSITFGGFWCMNKVVSAAELPAETAYEIFDEVNAERTAAGLPELQWSNDIETKVSNVRAEEASVKWSHTRPNGQKWWGLQKICKILGGENLAYVTEGDEASVISNWMGSSAHRDNILYSDFRTGAVSCYERDGYTYVAMNFGY